MALYLALSHALGNRHNMRVITSTVPCLNPSIDPNIRTLILKVLFEANVLKGHGQQEEDMEKHLGYTDWCDS